MALSSGRVLPTASVVLYDEAQGDPVVTDHGFAWRDDPLRSAPYASLSVNALGRSYLEFLPEIGLTCKPRLVYQDVNLAHYSTGLGSWERRRLGTGTPLTYRLVQYDTTADLTYSAGGPGLPANPQVCFSLILPDTPSDWDSALYPPYVRIELAGGYALEWDREGGRLLKLDATTAAWVTACDLPQLLSGDYVAGGENFIYLRCLRGRIGISTDKGLSYKWHGEPGSISLPAGAFTLRGRGGSVLFGLHQLAFSEGVYTSPRKNTLPPPGRVTATVTSSKREDLNGGAIVLADLSSFASAYAQYTATLTPSTTAGTPFTFHSSPVLYAATIKYNVVKTTPTLGSTTPWDSRLISIETDKPLELAGGTCTIRIKRDPGTTLTGNYRNRKVGVYLGTKVGAAAPSLDLKFTGYISNIGAGSQEWGDTELVITLENASRRFRRTVWEPNQILALSELAAGGATYNQAADYILASRGLGSTYRIWHVRGDIPMAMGSVEEPQFLLTPESPWETLTRLFGILGLEVGVFDDGTFVTVLRDYYSGTVHVMDARETADIEKLPTALGMQQDYNETVTAIYVVGMDAAGAPIIAGAIDVFAETNTALGTFSAWREAIVESMPDTCDQATTGLRAGELARDLFGVKKEADTASFVKLALARRDQIEILNADEQGIPNGTNYVILTEKIRYSQNEGDPEMTMQCGLRRIA